MCFNDDQMKNCPKQKNMQNFNGRRFVVRCNAFLQNPSSSSCRSSSSSAATTTAARTSTLMTTPGRRRRRGSKRRSVNVKHHPNNTNDSNCVAWGGVVIEEYYEEKDVVLVENNLKKTNANNSNDDDNKMKSIVFSTTRSVDARDVERLCDRVGWAKRPAEKLKIALENSFLVAQLLFVEEGKGGTKIKLVGILRATSDHAFNACLWDVIVDPSFQGQGLGKALVSHSIRVLLARDVANVTLFADKDVVDFYESLGFVKDANGVKGMFLYPKE